MTSQHLVDLLQLDLHVLAQLFVERAERFIHQHERWLEHQGARQRDALLLSARKLRRLAILELLQSHHFERALDARPNIGLWRLPHRERKGDVVFDAHMGEERVVLENHADIAFIRRKPIDRLAGEGDHALARPFEPGQHVQGCRLAGTGWTEECQEFAAPNGQVQPFDGLEVAIEFLDVDELDKRFVSGFRVPGRGVGSAGRRCSGSAARGRREVQTPREAGANC